MAQIIKASAIVNNEVAFLAWRTDPDPLPGCLGFHIVREILDGSDQVVESRPLAAYVSFEGQSNRDWQSQNTSTWPVQKFNWRDLTLRRRRDQAQLRPENERLRYHIRPVGHMRAGLDPVEPIPESHFDKKLNRRVDHTYQGAPIPHYLGPAKATNVVNCTRRRGPFMSAFTNGILSSQFLIRVLEEDDGKIGPNELGTRLRDPADDLRRYLAGDVPTTMTKFLSRQGGTFHAALYELEDRQLVDLLTSAAPRMKLILSDAGDHETKDPVTKKVIHTDYDTRNAPARNFLRQIANAKGSTFVMQNRLFNGSGHIGHNKFIVWSNDQNVPQAVLTGSTNWTWSGICGQSNNCIVIEDENVARAFLSYWQRLFDNPLSQPATTADANTGPDQGDVVKTAGRTPVAGNLSNGAAFECWYSPNTPCQRQPPSARAKHQPPPPPDMDRLFSLMRRAHRIILFTVFLPSKGGVHSVISQAMDLGLADTSLEVIGAVSDPMAWGYQPSGTGRDGRPLVPTSPYVIQQGGVNVVRATALTDRDIGRQLGNFVNKEILSAGKAIIHDKILVVDPLDRENYVVAFGSHNLGYKASYSNDENLVIIQRDPELAQAYAAHVLDVFDHYRFRAAEAEKTAALKRSGAALPADSTGGFLRRDDSWQTDADRRLARYFAQ
jgi:phosphatidylserine/phosphatidylglycerophosphate/cardiolipin synthase-like enzyme